MNIINLLLYIIIIFISQINHTIFLTRAEKTFDFPIWLKEFGLYVLDNQGDIVLKECKFVPGADYFLTLPHIRCNPSRFINNNRIYNHAFIELQRLFYTNENYCSLKNDTIIDAGFYINNNKKRKNLTTYDLNVKNFDKANIIYNFSDNKNNKTANFIELKFASGCIIHSETRFVFV